MLQRNLEQLTKMKKDEPPTKAKESARSELNEDLTNSHSARSPPHQVSTDQLPPGD